VPQNLLLDINPPQLQAVMQTVAITFAMTKMLVHNIVDWAIGQTTKQIEGEHRMDPSSEKDSTLTSWRKCLRQWSKSLHPLQNGDKMMLIYLIQAHTLRVPQGESTQLKKVNEEMSHQRLMDSFWMIVSGANTRVIVPLVTGIPFLELLPHALELMKAAVPDLDVGRLKTLWRATFSMAMNKHKVEHIPSRVTGGRGIEKPLHNVWQDLVIPSVITSAMLVDAIPRNLFVGGAEEVVTQMAQNAE
jgi:hypothetical protein